MPLYEFVCRQCGNKFECLTKIGGEKGVSCPVCASFEVTKIFSSFGIGGGSSRLVSSGSGCSSCSSRSCSTCK